MNAFKQKCCTPNSNILAYSLKWFDEVITITLNPAGTDVHMIIQAQATLLTTKVDQEARRIMSLLPLQIFSVTGRRKLKQFVRRYHATLIFLINSQSENATHPVFREPFLQDLHCKIAACLEMMVTFIEKRYGIYISLKEKAPASYFALTKTTLSAAIKNIEKNLLPQGNDWPLGSLLLQALNDFMNTIPEAQEITYRDILYMKILVSELARLKTPQSVKGSYTALDGLLVSLNFNQKPYLDYLTQYLAASVNAATGLTEKLDLLLNYYKSFKQLYRKPGLAFNPTYKSVDAVMCNWFKQEIQYLKYKLRLPGDASQIKPDNSIAKSKQEYTRQKITCRLSSDQMALVLRSLDDLRIISARSLNDVFRTIVPHLSTQHKQELSFEAMRSKSYTAEVQDQQKVAEMLEEMIQKIKSY